MPVSRSYQDACGVSHALDLLGERWAMHVVRELMLGPKRFTDLHGDLPGISTNVLAARLAELERTGVVLRRRLDPPAASWVYELTAWGSALEPVLCSLGRWAAASPLHDRTAHLSVTSFVLSLRTNFDAAVAGDLALAVQLRIGREDFAAEVRSGQLKVDRGTLDRPAATLTGQPQQLAAVIYGGLSPAAAGVAVDGDVSAAGRFLQMFPLPQQIEPVPQPVARRARSA